MDKKQINKIVNDLIKQTEFDIEVSKASNGSNLLELEIKLRSYNLFKIFPKTIQEMKEKKNG